MPSERCAVGEMKRRMEWERCICCVCGEGMDDEPYSSFEVGACHSDLTTCQRNNGLKMLVLGNVQDSIWGVFVGNGLVEPVEQSF